MKKNLFIFLAESIFTMEFAKLPTLFLWGAYHGVMSTGQYLVIIKAHALCPFISINKPGGTSAGFPASLT
jgi:hypothetical protein